MWRESILFFFFSSALTTVVAQIHDWNYDELGPDVWSERYPSCGGQLQSPINILTACTAYQNFTPFVFAVGYNEEHNFTLQNNGHTIVGTYNNDQKLALLRLKGGNLNGTFEFANFHLHWGENHKSGSEHEVNGLQYAGELHFVYQNPLTLQRAVLGIFMQSVVIHDESDNTTIHFFEEETRHEWKRFFDQAQTLKEENDSALFQLNLASLMGENLQDFWRYEGSLTTPPCTEGVIWTLFKQPILFVESELQSFRKNLYFEDYRRPQPLYNRIVKRNFLDGSYSSVPDYNCCPGKNGNRAPLDASSSSERIFYFIHPLFIVIAVSVFLSC